MSGTIKNAVNVVNVFVGIESWSIAISDSIWDSNLYSDGIPARQISSTIDKSSMNLNLSDAGSLCALSLLWTK